MTDDKTITINFSVQPGQEIDFGKMFENAMRRGQIKARLERLSKHKEYLSKVTNEVDHLRWSIIKEEFKLNEELNKKQLDDMLKPGKIFYERRYETPEPHKYKLKDDVEIRILTCGTMPSKEWAPAVYLCMLLGSRHKVWVERIGVQVMEDKDIRPRKERK